jgi:acyl-CoA reductase-like NAD-dependent aldehyde dehydrogenase
MTGTDTRVTTLDARLLIGGERVQGEGGALGVENPATEEEIASVGIPSEAQIAAAVAELMTLAGPFGGFKQSGLGRELGREGLEAFQETKHVHIETEIAPKEWWYPYGGT